MNTHNAEKAGTKRRTRVPASARWVDRGLVMLSNHEPLTFRIRRGMPAANAAEQFRYEHSEDFVRRAARFGITCLRTHYYKGGGIRYESPEMRQTADFVRLCHQHGIRVQGYIQHGTLSYETLFLEEPRYRQWVARDQHGHTSSVTYGHQFFRYKPCFNQRGHTDYLKRVIRRGIADGLDMLGFDNAAWSTEPTACQCGVCRRKFRTFLNRKYPLRTAAGRQRAWELFALPSFAHVEPPAWHRWAMPTALFEVGDPLIREWIDFKCECLRESIAELGAYARALKPDIVLEWNCYGSFGDNAPLWIGVDVYRNAAHLDAVYNEQDPYPGLTSDGVLTNMIRSFKLLRSYGKFMLPNCNYRATDEEQVKLSMAENLAFNAGHIGMLPGGFTPGAVDAHQHPDRRRYVDFASRNRVLFNGATSVADVAVLESFDTLAFTRIEPHHSLVAIYQTLLAGNISYDVLTLDHLNRLDACRLVILPNVKLLADKHAERLLAYVRAGGMLLVTEQSGAFDADFRRRAASPFAGREGRYGKGLIRHIAALKHRRTFSYKPEDWYIDPRLWQLPANQAEVLSAVRQLLGQKPVLEVEAPFGCVSALYRVPEAYVLHLLNYNTRKPVPRIAVRLRTSEQIVRATRMSPEEGDGKALAFRRTGDQTVLRVRGLQRYQVLLLELDRGSSRDRMARSGTGFRATT